jgi:uncharacterized protein (DUF58 family)
MAGVAYGTQRSRRKGQGAEIAGARPYRPGDRLAWIDWYASARESLIRDDDVFVVREYYAEVAPRVVIVPDRHPSMGLYPSDLPWLSKSNVLQHALTAITAAAVAARAYVGYLDFSRGGERHAASRRWVAPHRQGSRQVLKRARDEFDAPANGLQLAIEYLLELPQDVPAGTFVFVLSDFLHPPPDQIWSRARARGWDVVPTIIQDRFWEQSFPAVQGLLVPFLDPETGRSGAVRVSGHEARERQASNAERLRAIRLKFERLEFDTVLLDADDPAAVDLAFFNWAARRSRRQRRLPRLR